MTVGIFVHPYLPAAPALAREIADWLRAQGVRVWETDSLDERVLFPHLPDTDLLITLGGDGSILRAAHHTAGHPTLILGVNLGRMGFLTEAEPNGWKEVLSRMVKGEYWVEERMMLRAVRAGGYPLWDALNDVVVGPGTLGRVVHLEARVDGDLLTTYVADGLIVATPTGSTAYALAAGGPIMPPHQRNILLVPVAPHLSLDRAVVLSEGVRVQVVVRSPFSVSLVVDGDAVAELAPGEAVEVGASPRVARFARVRERDYFYRTLMARLVPRR
ncbi:MAG: NAD(+)/NADH kinase [Anaerolineae bacterium]|nr:NAD(+)/NADH kinase [Anaerolineae bacterium]